MLVFDKSNVKRSTFIIICFLTSATILRFLISNWLGVWYYSHAGHDDVLMINYSVFVNHFRFPNYRSLVKTIAYPIFLNVVHFSGLSLPIVITIVWLFAAITIVCLFKLFTNSKFFLAFTYLFVLFTPIAFELNVGTRIYRNAIMPPFYFILFGFILIVSFGSIKNALTLKWSFILNLVLAMVFLFTYYINESGLWLLPCLFLGIIVSIIHTIYWYVKRSVKRKRTLIIAIFFLLIPLFTFKLGTELYQRVNYRFFGVAEITTRTNGELGDFVNHIYRIYSPNRTSSIWAPYDAIEKAFEVSETLHFHPQLKEAIFHTDWFSGDIRTNPIKGDFLTWVLRSALNNTGMWTSEREVSDLFTSVNSDLREAFETGRLSRDNRIQINSAAGGRTRYELWDLRYSLTQSYRSFFLLDGYAPGGRMTNDRRFRPSELTQFITNVSVAEDHPSAISIQRRTINFANGIVLVLFGVYRIVNPIIGVTAILGIGFTTFLLLRKKCNEKKYLNLLILLTAIGLTLIGALYALAIGWFAEFIWENLENHYEQLPSMRALYMNFYGTGIIPLFSIAVLLGNYLLFDGVKHIWKK